MYLPAEKEQASSKCVRYGSLGVNVPEELGGVGLNVLGNCLVDEELAQTIVLSILAMFPRSCSNAILRRREVFAPAFSVKAGYMAIMEPEKGRISPPCL